MKENKQIPVLFTSEKDCCGCAACAAVCPKNAISMIADELGFKYPYIQEEKCVVCKKCIEICTFK